MCDDEVRCYVGCVESGWPCLSRTLTSSVPESGLEVVEGLGEDGRGGAAADGDVDSGVVR